MAIMGSRVARTEQRKPPSGQLPPRIPLDIDSPIGVILSASAGDHLAIQQFLLNIFKPPFPAADFNSLLDNPIYEPSNRLLIRHGSMIIAHSRVIDRDIQFGKQQIPISCLTELATTPEFRRHGVATALLRAVDEQMRLNGSVAGMLRTTIPHFFASHGWALCTSPVQSVTGVHEILSHLISLQREEDSLRAVNPLNAPLQRLNIRLWRHVEQDALMRIYQLNTKGRYGAHVRSEATWRWLFNRRIFDHIYVALENTEKIALGASLHSIIGYAVVNSGRVIECLVDEGREDARNQLLQRVCSDVIEHADEHVTVDAWVDDALHDIVLKSGGEQISPMSAGQEVTMMKLFDPIDFIRRIRHEFRARVRLSGLAIPCELGLNIDEERFRIVCNSRSTRLLKGKVGRSYLTCSSQVLSQLLIGQRSVTHAIEAGELVSSTRIAEETAQVMFPQLPLWFPPLDDLPA